jgi:hypothetical protein
VEQQQRSISVVAESTHEPKVSLFALFFIFFNPVPCNAIPAENKKNCSQVMESNVTEDLVYNEEQKAQDSSSNASSTGKFEHLEEKVELKVSSYYYLLILKSITVYASDLTHTLCSIRVKKLHLASSLWSSYLESRIKLPILLDQLPRSTRTM